VRTLVVRALAAALLGGLVASAPATAAPKARATYIVQLRGGVPDAQGRALVRATGGPLVLTGCGTSEHAAMAGAHMLRDAAPAGIREAIPAANPRSDSPHSTRRSPSASPPTTGRATFGSSSGPPTSLVPS
jgi:hypothetical protein